MWGSVLCQWSALPVGSSSGVCTLASKLYLLSVFSYYTRLVGGVRCVKGAFDVYIWSLQGSDTAVYTSREQENSRVILRHQTHTSVATGCTEHYLEVIVGPLYTSSTHMLSQIGVEYQLLFCYTEYFSVAVYVYVFCVLCTHLQVSWSASTAPPS